MFYISVLRSRVFIADNLSYLSLKINWYSFCFYSVRKTSPQSAKTCISLTEKKEKTSTEQKSKVLHSQHQPSSPQPRLPRHSPLRTSLSQ